MPRRLSLGNAASFAAWRAPTAEVYLDVPLDVAPQLGTSLTNVELAELVDRTAEQLWAAGLRAGDRIAVCKQNNFDIVVLTCAAARLGAVPALLNPRVGTDDRATMLDRLAPRLIVSDAVGDARTATQSVQVKSIDSSVTSVQRLGKLRTESPVRHASRPPELPALITHTSGTTGVPKWVVHSGLSIMGQARMQMPLAWLLIRRGDVLGACLQWAHARSFVLWIASGHLRTSFLALSRADEEDAVAALVVRHRPTYFEAHPDDFLRWDGLGDRNGRPFASVRVFMSTFDAAHPRIVRAVLKGSNRLMPVYLQVYAQSETGGVSVRVNTRLSRKNAPGRSVGRPILPFTRFRIVDPQTHRPSRRGVAGTIESITPGTCLTYLGEEDEAVARRSGRWWDMRDIGSKTWWGALQVHDRAVELLDGGTSALELEDVLLDRLHQCTEVVVLGAQGGPPVPVVCVRKGDDLTSGDWRTAVQGLTSLAEPVHLQRAAIPRTATGKVRRRALAEQLGITP